MNCLAVDDEPFALEIIRLHTEKVPFLHLENTFRSALEALAYLQNHSVDLIFLDINMPDLSGIDFAKSLTNKPLLIFTTAYSEFALTGYELNVVDYLLKPIEFPRFLTAVNKANDLLSLKSKAMAIEIANSQSIDNQLFIFIKSGNQIHKIQINDILFLESDGNYITYYLANQQKILARQTIPEAMAQLSDNQFIRVHKSYIVAFKHIDLLEKHQLKIKNHFIPISSTYREDFFKKVKGVF
jgi:DNA-binding LytR/AlgR family response regulator